MGTSRRLFLLRPWRCCCCCFLGNGAHGDYSQHACEIATTSLDLLLLDLPGSHALPCCHATMLCYAMLCLLPAPLLVASTCSLDRRGHALSSLSARRQCPWSTQCQQAAHQSPLALHPWACSQPKTDYPGPPALAAAVMHLPFCLHPNTRIVSSDFACLLPQ